MKSEKTRRNKKKKIGENITENKIKEKQAEIMKEREKLKMTRYEGNKSIIQHLSELRMYLGLPFAARKL